MSGGIVSSGATYVVSAGVTESGDIVTGPGSLLIVGSGGTTIGATATSGGTEEVLAGGVASGTVIAGGTLELASGGSAGAGAITFSRPPLPGTGGAPRLRRTGQPSDPHSRFGGRESVDL